MFDNVITWKPNSWGTNLIGWTVFYATGDRRSGGPSLRWSRWRRIPDSRWARPVAPQCPGPVWPFHRERPEGGGRTPWPWGRRLRSTRSPKECSSSSPMFPCPGRVVWIDAPTPSEANQSKIYSNSNASGFFFFMNFLWIFLNKLRRDNLPCPTAWGQRTGPPWKRLVQSLRHSFLKI